MSSDKSPHPLVVYGHENCTQATSLRTVLNNYGVEFQWKDVHASEMFADELRLLARGYLSVPTVIYPDASVDVEPFPRQVLRKLKIEVEKSFWANLWQ
ncbi:MAG TPA: glutaredoxin domain-containing protein [Anaerolineales bacterium]|nr:glutaredoxin domain-containing protein [Anaerolineales bacterium]